MFEGPAEPPAPGPAQGRAPATARVWDLRTGREVLTLESSTVPLGPLAFSSDGSQVAAAANEPGRPGEVRVWESKTGRLVLAFRGHTGAVFAVAFSPDGRHIASGGEDGAVMVWTVALPAPAAPPPAAPKAP
jgi:WD40 repeat protein